MGRKDARLGLLVLNSKALCVQIGGKVCGSEAEHLLSVYETLALEKLVFLFL